MSRLNDRARDFDNDPCMGGGCTNPDPTHRYGECVTPRRHGGPRTPGPGKRLGRPPGGMGAKLVVRLDRAVLDAYREDCEARGIEMAEDVRLHIVERLRRVT